MAAAYRLPRRLTCKCGMRCADGVTQPSPTFRAITKIAVSLIIVRVTVGISQWKKKRLVHTVRLLTAQMLLRRQP